MEPQTITAFVAIGFAIFIGFFGNLIFARYKIPDVLIMVTVGVVLGPDILGLVSNVALDDINQYRDLFLSVALVLILFDGGLSLDIHAVAESVRLATMMTVTILLGEILAIAAILHFFLDIDFVLACVIGTIVGGPSSAIVIPIANGMRIRPKTKAHLIWESVLTDVLVITIALSLMTLIQIGDFSVLGIGQQIAIKFLIAAGIGFIGGVAWLFVLQKLRDQPLSYMLTVGALFIVAGLVEMEPIRSSGAVAALMFGLAIGNKRDVRRWLTSMTLKPSPNGHIQEFHTEITFFVRTFFFVYLGLLIRFSTFELADLAAGIVIIVVIVSMRRLTTEAAHASGALEKEDAHAIFGMMARGLATAVLATMPVVLLADSDVWDPAYETFIINVALIVIIGTTLVTTVLSLLTEREIDKRIRIEMRRKLVEESEQT